ncbi:MAG: nitrous oxide-stimulated promoter family protein [Candidatus Thorarchaeota archaeon]
MYDESNSSNIGPKIRKEKDTVEKMIRLYCEKKHSTSSTILCSECRNLLEYSYQRLEQCQYQEDKPTCRKCPVHCYRPAMRKEIRRVMRFSGPRLVLRAPLDWIRHQINDREDGEPKKVDERSQQQ